MPDKPGKLESVKGTKTEAPVPIPWAPSDEDPFAIKCPKCQRDLSKCDLYCCPDPKCPVQTRVTC